MRQVIPALACWLALVGCSQRIRPAGRAPAPAAPAVYSTLNRHIVNALDAGEGDFTLGALRRQLAADPANPQVRLQLAKRYRELGFPDLALEHARLAAERFPDLADAQIEQARALRAMGLTAEAAELLEAFFRMHPRASANVPAWLGILRDELGQWQAGEAAHRAAVAMAPERDDLYNNLGYNLLKQGKHQEARKALERALELNPDSRAARNNLGLVLAATGSGAFEAFRRAGDPATAHNNLACALIEQGRYREARKELESALAYNRNHPAALANLRLLAQLDGQHAAVSLRQAPRSSWGRFWSAVWRKLAGFEESGERPQR
ncbi:MAG: tetratricopeptide repeat protein [Bryobacterales bacterium]|nr:tetratricopeptide repeat protein [Bryobacteraceae bacterium]MDW8131683.1 tetratricopeptide repeat protein [Bryobacterales bacterium]